MNAVNTAIDVLVALGFGLLAGLFVRFVFMILDMFGSDRVVDGGTGNGVPRPEELDANARLDGHGATADGASDVYEHERERAGFVLASTSEAVVRGMRSRDVREARAAAGTNYLVTHEQSLDREMSKGEVR